MWHLVEKISQQVTKYSTVLGQFWYLCVFVFRLIVVVTIGGGVYGDEQSAFKCSADVVGCTQMCFNVFSKISHIRFWSFQILAVATPTIFFHFYSTNVAGEIEKLKKDEEKLAKVEEGEDDAMVDDPKLEKDFKRMSKKKKRIGNIKVKKVYSGGDLKEIPFTTKIHISYFVSVIFRVVIEGVFIYLSYDLFRFMDKTNVDVDADWTVLEFLWFKVPALYTCTSDHPGVKKACSQHFLDGSGFVPCWVSRPWEKTILVRYMNVLSAICFLVSVMEFVYLVLKGVLGKRHRHRPRFFTQRPQPKQDAVFYATAPNGHHLQNEIYPTLAAPVRLNSRYQGSTKMSTGRRVQINGKDEIVEEIDLGSTASVKRS